MLEARGYAAAETAAPDIGDGECVCVFLIFCTHSSMRQAGGSKVHKLESETWLFQLLGKTKQKNYRVCEILTASEIR